LIFVFILFISWRRLIHNPHLLLLFVFHFSNIMICTFNSRIRYFQSTYSTTQASGATMNFTFFGTSIYIHGSKRRTHGSFEVQIDNTTYDSIIIQNSLDLFQELLFSVDKLKNALHEVVVTNVGLGNNEGLDIDFVRYLILLLYNWLHICGFNSPVLRLNIKF